MHSHDMPKGTGSLFPQARNTRAFLFLEVAMLMTANPHYDAECYENEQDLRARTAEALEIEAYGIAFAALGSKQASWFKEHDIGRGLFIAPDLSLIHI